MNTPQKKAKKPAIDDLSFHEVSVISDLPQMPEPLVFDYSKRALDWKFFNQSDGSPLDEHQLRQIDVPKLMRISSASAGATFHIPEGYPGEEILDGLFNKRNVIEIQEL